MRTPENPEGLLPASTSATPHAVRFRIPGRSILESSLIRQVARRIGRAAEPNNIPRADDVQDERALHPELGGDEDRRMNFDELIAEPDSAARARDARKAERNAYWFETSTASVPAGGK